MEQILDKADSGEVQLARAANKHPGKSGCFITVFRLLQV